MIGIRRVCWALAASALVSTSPTGPREARPEAFGFNITADPIPSWNDGEVKRAILDFVTRVTTAGGPDFVPPSGRIAVFDNDGTLWPENPVPFQLAFVLDELKRLAPEHPEWRDDATIQAAIRGDLRVVMARGMPAILELLAATHEGDDGR